ncbi:MAG: phosphotransferase [Acidobacteria bacterium]|nr:phosphotransferase [Acidobacteriota bacterium]
MNNDPPIEPIRRALPGRPAASAVFLGEGDFFRAFLVDGEWVFRFARHAEAAQSLAREFCLLPRIASRLTLSIPVPELAALDAAPPFTAYRLLRGRELSRELYLAMNDARRTDCAGRVARFLNELHALDPQTLADCGVPATDYRAQYGALADDAKEHLFDVLSRAERRFVETTIDEYLSAGQSEAFAPCLLHGDLSPDHVLFDEETGAVTGIIDFGDAMIGDPAWDLVWIYEDYGTDFLARLLPALDEPDRRGLLERVFAFACLQTIEWASDCRRAASDDLDEALAGLRSLVKTRRRRFDELTRL